MITSTKVYWSMTELVSEYIDPKGVESFMALHFSKDWGYVTFKTSKDEVLQMYNDDICYTIIGGSSADKWEWKSNFNWLPLKSKLIHRGFYDLALEVIGHDDYIERPQMVVVGHSRGGACASVIAHQLGIKGIGFGVPKAFRKKVDIDFINVRNPLDPVCSVVPFFRTVGRVISVRFFRHPHTGYGKAIKKGDTID